MIFYGWILLSTAEFTYSFRNFFYRQYLHSVPDRKNGYLFRFNTINDPVVPEKEFSGLAVANLGNDSSDLR